MSFNLTPKQKAFANHYIETGSAPEAAISAYDCSSRNVARVIAHRNLNNAKVRSYLQEQLLTKDLMDESIATLRRALTSTKPVSVNGETVEWPDTTNQVKTAEHLLRLAMKLTDVAKDTNNISAEDYDNKYWEEYYIDKHGRKPTSNELAKFREVIDVVPEDVQVHAFRSEKVAVSLMPKDFVDE